MSRQIITLGVLSLVLLAGSVSLAERYEHSNGGISIDVPDGWSVQNGDDVIAVEPPDESMVVMLWVPRGTTLKKAIAGLEDELAPYITDAEITQHGEEGEFNGMAYYEVSGSGIAENVEVEWTVTVLMAKRPVIALAVAEPDAWKNNRADAMSLIKGIKKIS